MAVNPQSRTQRALDKASAMGGIERMQEQFADFMETVLEGIN